MSDLISREDAIDAFDKELSAKYNRMELEIGFVGIKSILENLPSAQPEPQWIACSEKLPREYTRVIGYMAWHAITTIEYQHGRWYSIDHLEPLPDEAVSHWMPLPKPPKGE